jgi:hypothetical protein
MGILLDQGRLFYSRLRKKLGSKTAPILGKIEKNSKRWPDLFGWLFCCKRIRISTAGASILKDQWVEVYLPNTLPIPLVGETVAAFDLGHRFGFRRHFGILYAPHMSVTRGVGRT